MTTRQRRFFVMLVHLLGASLPTYTHRNHHSSYAGRGVSATWPVWPLVLERIQWPAQDPPHQPQQQPQQNHPRRPTPTARRYESSSSGNVDYPSTHEPNPKTNEGRRRRRRRRSSRTDTDNDTDSDDTDSVTALSVSSSSPLWLQNTRDGSCLGPWGTFSDCGDATVWWMEEVPVSSLPRDSRRSRHNQNESSNSNSSSYTTLESSDAAWTRQGYIFRVVDCDATLNAAGAGAVAAAAAAVTARPATAECLSATEHEDHHHSPSTTRVVHVVPCPAVPTTPRRPNRPFGWMRRRQRQRQRRTTKQRRTAMVDHQRSIVWRMAPNGQLQHASSLSSSSSSSLHQDDSTNEIVWHCVAAAAAHPLSPLTPTTTGGTSHNRAAVLVDCGKNDDDNNNNTHVPVQFALFRYRPVAASTLKSVVAATTVGERKGLQPSAKEKATVSSLQDPLLHPELKIASKLIFDLPNVKPPRQSSSSSSSSSMESVAKRESTFLIRLLMHANPSLVALQPSRQIKNDRLSNNDFPAIDESALKLRRMQSHPYLAEAKDGVWTDPQTGLTFHTDLCRYLGRNCNEQGRHTLTGMGIYRKGYVIKVYGIAYYVSKRDVLVNPSMERYATLTAEQLRARPDFYEMLRKVGHFDRTIMLKTNMQLSAETMRSSLQADWSYLTEEAKSTLVGVSMNPRPADDAMLNLIQSPDNPSRCSCSQTAPPEFNANPDCCARGTELVFTWTKTNDLEVRLNGRLMEAFPRPDIAEGIFYEYLRYDDPISPELLDRVVDGFPFILGPIAGINDQAMTNPSENAVNQFQAMLEAMTAMKDTFILQAIDFGDSVKRSASDTADHAGNAVKAFGLATKEFAVEADRRRDLLVKHTVAASTVLMKLLEHDEATIQSLTRWMTGETNEQDIPEEDEDTLLSSDHRLPRGRIFGYSLSRLYGEEYFAPDEIGPMRIHPTINKFFLTLVHLYLLLMFIVSFPGSHSTRTRLVSRKSAYSGQDLSDDSDSDISEDNDKMSLDESMELDPQRVRALYGARGYIFSANRNPTQREKEISKILPPAESGFRKKSLSYFL